jgi:Fe-S cluster biosynthesis and repair protein YggX
MESGVDMVRTVKCVKIGRELPGMARPPFPGPLGQRVFENVSQQAWGLWQQQSTLIINHYGLNLADPQAQEFLMQQLEEFFFGAGAQMPEDWIPEGEGAPGGKGGPAPRKK